MQRSHQMILLLLLALACAGCYTLLSHPGSTVYVEEDRGGESYYRDCRDCHQDAAYYHSGYRWSDYRYSQRYYNPWWYDDYWFYDPNYPGGWWPHDGGAGGSDAPQGTWDDSRRQKRDGDEPIARQLPGPTPPPEAGAQGSSSQVQEGDAGNGNAPQSDEEKAKDERAKHRRQKR